MHQLTISKLLCNKKTALIFQNGFHILNTMFCFYFSSPTGRLGGAFLIIFMSVFRLIAITAFMQAFFVLLKSS